MQMSNFVEFSFLFSILFIKAHFYTYWLKSKQVAIFFPLVVKRIRDNNRWKFVFGRKFEQNNVSGREEEEEDEVVEKKQSLPALMVKSRNKEKEEMSREWDGNEAERPRRVALPSNASFKH